MSTPYASFPAGRPRRLRRDDFTRRLVRENRLSADDFIYPVINTTSEAKSLIAMYSAQLAPTAPAPTTVTFIYTVI